jgi:hypothetical protein
MDAGDKPPTCCDVPVKAVAGAPAVATKALPKVRKPCPCPQP